jgi:ribonuclease HI
MTVAAQIPTQVDDVDEPLALLRRYRRLCEASGLARAHRMTLADDVSADLALVEQRLGALLREVIALRARQTSPSPRARESNAAPEQPTPESTSTAPAQTDQRSVYHLAENGRPANHAGTESRTGQPAAATVFTDGSAEGNPGPGGYCAIVRVPGLPDRELSGGANYTTNNKMELTAAIVGVRAALDAGARQVTVVTDSEYLVKGMTRWLSGWLTKGWRTSDGQPVKNRELWEQLAELARRGTLRWQWIRGHAGHSENERCDTVATAAARKAATGS